jgi:3-hydroxyacyl-[acyl-carrier-protein] dehydratase
MPDENTVYYFAGIDNARFKRPVSPGDQVIMDDVDRTKAGILKATSSVDGQLVCQAVAVHHAHHSLRRR